MNDFCMYVIFVCGVVEVDNAVFEISYIFRILNVIDICSMHKFALSC